MCSSPFCCVVHSRIHAGATFMVCLRGRFVADGAKTRVVVHTSGKRSRPEVFSPTQSASRYALKAQQDNRSGSSRSTAYPTSTPIGIDDKLFCSKVWLIAKEGYRPRPMSPYRPTSTPCVRHPAVLARSRFVWVVILACLLVGTCRRGVSCRGLKDACM